jgi:hypothetical protein
MLKLRTRADLQRLVEERLVESLTLEYKAAPALNRTNDGRSELVKDATAMANSAGGQIVYGITERRGVPSGIDEGVDRTVITPEWIGQVLATNTSPRLQYIEITPVPLEEGSSTVAYVLTIPQGTVFAPHQNTMDHKYYRRFEQRAVPMADYEIRDILRRARTPLLQVRYSFPGGEESVGVQRSGPIFHLLPTLENIGPEPSLYSLFDFLIDARLDLHRLPGDLAKKRQRSDLGFTCNSFQQVFMVPETFPLISGTSVTLTPEEFILEIPDGHFAEGSHFAIGYNALSAQGCKVTGFQLLVLHKERLSLTDHKLLYLNEQPMFDTQSISSSISDLEQGAPEEA